MSDLTERLTQLKEQLGDWMQITLTEAVNGLERLEGERDRQIEQHAEAMRGWAEAENRAEAAEAQLSEAVEVLREIEALNTNDPGSESANLARSYFDNPGGTDE